MTSIPQSLAGFSGLPTAFMQEQDAILLAQPFTAGIAPIGFSLAHEERLQEAVQRRFVRSLSALEYEGFHRALERSCTATLRFRLQPDVAPPNGPAALLLTCAPNAHLALANFLERKALFTVETIGRVIQREGQAACCAGAIP